MLEITDGDATPQMATVLPGESITLLVLLTGPSGSRIDSFVYDVEFSAPGLFYQSYEFDETAFLAGNRDDFSMPAMADLPQPPASPHIITAASYSNLPSSPGDVDIHFEAASAVDAQGVVLTFGNGVLARIHLSVPRNFITGEVLITPRPDTFALGSDIVDTIPGAAFRLSVAGGAAPGGTPGSADGSVGAGGSDPALPPNDNGTIPSGGVVDNSSGAANGVANDNADSVANGVANDDDGDGVANDVDLCPSTSPGTVVDETGCPIEPAPSQQVPMDQDHDGVLDNADLCPNTPAGVTVGDDGCAVGEAVSAADNLTHNRRGVCGAIGLLNLSWVATTLVGLRRPWRGFRRRVPKLL